MLIFFNWYWYKSTYWKWSLQFCCLLRKSRWDYKYYAYPLFRETQKRANFQITLSAHCLTIVSSYSRILCVTDFLFLCRSDFSKKKVYPHAVHAGITIWLDNLNESKSMLRQFQLIEIDIYALFIWRTSRWHVVYVRRCLCEMTIAVDRIMPLG